MALLNTLMAINLINGNIWLYAAILVVALVAVFFLALRKVEVVYVDPDEDYEIAHTKYGWGRKIDVATANKNGKIFVGWSYDENGEKRLGKKQIRVWKSTELYAVWQKPVVGITVEDANAVLEITFKNKDGEEISKEIRPFAIDIPEEADGEKILGWNYEGAEDEGSRIVASDKEKNIIPVNLVPVYESSDEAVAEEPAYEEPVVEEEAVADEEVAVADEEVVAEEPVAEEAVAEEPVAEEVVAEEQVAEEPVAEEPVVEDEAVAEEVAEEAAPVEPIIVPTYVDGQGRKINIKYSRSIQANVIQAEDKVKNYYSELKNHILSYKGVKSRFSWKFDSYNKGREQLFKIKVRGKTVCLYCALNPEEFDKSRYHHEAVDAKMLADVPMLVKVKSDLGLKKAKELVDIVMAKHEIVVNPKAVSVDYVNEYPYEETDALVQRGLIKVLEADENDVKVAAPAEDAVAEEPVAEEVVVEEPVVEDEAVAEEVAEEAAPVEPIIVPTYVDGQGRKINIKYSRSIQANVIQAEDKVKNYYSELKNHILSYKGVKSRFSWKFDSYNKGREQLFKIKVRGKTVCLYCALNPEEFDKSRYHHEAVDAKMLADVPMLVKVKSDLGLKKAKELVDIVMAKHEIVVNPKAVSVDYVNEYPYEETDALVQRGLIKVLEADENDVKVAAPAEDAVAEEVVVEEQVAEEVVAEEPVVEDEVVAEEPLFEEVIEEPIPVDDEPVVEEEAVAEEVVADEEPVVEEEAVAEEVVADEEPVVEEEAVAEEVVADEEPVAEEEAVADEVVADEEPVAEEEVVAEEVVADEEPVAEEEAVAEEVVADEEPVVEEEAVAEEVVADEEPVVEEEVVAEEIAPATSVEEMQIVESVSADEVDNLVVDEVVDSLVEEDVEYITEDDNKKAIVNIDTISQSYEAGEVVDLASLKAKGLIHKKSKSVKILARGSIDKALTVKAAEFSETALKMIVLTGGKAVHTVSKVK